MVFSSVSISVGSNKPTSLQRVDRAVPISINAVMQIKADAGLLLILCRARR